MAEKTTANKMTEGPISRQILMFAVPLMIGNLFQMLYNSVDSIVVGNFVSTEALAAIGATTMIVNIAVFFFNGFSTGAGVVIARNYGAGKMEELHRSIETTMAATFIGCVLFTVVGIATTGPMLKLMSTPDNVFADADTYLRIYFAGIAGLLVYNMGSGILRAVGDTKRPLYFLILTSVLNIFLDLLFVLAFHQGIAGVAYATIISQAISAVLTLVLLIRTKDVYRFSFREMRIEGDILKQIIEIGLPTGIQAVITSFSNVFVQSYINYFGSVVIAGWTCYNRLDQFIMLPMQSMAMAATTFVGQNMGAGKVDRANDGTRKTIFLTLEITGVIAVVLFLFARDATRLFSSDELVIESGTAFLRANVFFMLFNCVCHVLAGALRGRGDSNGPMVIMLTGYVAIRQIYLFFMTRFILNTPVAVGFGYPVGWMATCAMEVLYFEKRWKRQQA
jgi:putative MATE family efflux protein